METITEKQAKWIPEAGDVICVRFPDNELLYYDIFSHFDPENLYLKDRYDHIICWSNADYSKAEPNERVLNMTEITEKQADAMLAEKIMKWVSNEVHFANQNHPWWTKDGVLVTTIKAWNPTTDERHAMQCLREFKKKNNPHRIVTYFIEDEHVAVDIHQMPSPWPTTESDEVDFCHAICIALLEAETGIKYEIKG